MPTLKIFRLHLATPPAVQAALVAFFVEQLGRDPESVGFSVRASPDGTGDATMHLSSELFTDEELAALRPYLSPGGGGYLLGMRARRGFNSLTESTENPPPAGKTLVTLINEGDPIPEIDPEVGWANLRFSFDRFLEELGVVRLEEAF